MSRIEVRNLDAWVLRFQQQALRTDHCLRGGSTRRPNAGAGPWRSRTHPLGSTTNFMPPNWSRSYWPRGGNA